MERKEKNEKVIEFRRREQRDSYIGFSPYATDWCVRRQQKLSMHATVTLDVFLLSTPKTELVVPCILHGRNFASFSCGMGNFFGRRLVTTFYYDINWR